MKEFFSKAAKALSVYLDPYGESELKKIEQTEKRFDQQNNKIRHADDFGDLIHEKTMQMMEQANNILKDGNPPRKSNPVPATTPQASGKQFNIPKPKSNIGILPPDDAAPVAIVPEVTPAQRASQVATVMAEGVQGKVKAPRTARFKKQVTAI